MPLLGTGLCKQNNRPPIVQYSAEAGSIGSFLRAFAYHKLKTNMVIKGWAAHGGCAEPLAWLILSQPRR